MPDLTPGPLFDPAEFLLLPGPGAPWVPRFCPPCPGCGATTFEVYRVRRRFRATGQPDQAQEQVESRCPGCPCLTDRTATRKTLLGYHDLRAGTLVLITSLTPAQELASAAPSR